MDKHLHKSIPKCDFTFLWIPAAVAGSDIGWPNWRQLKKNNDHIHIISRSSSSFFLFRRPHDELGSSEDWKALFQQEKQQNQIWRHSRRGVESDCLVLCFCWLIVCWTLSKIPLTLMMLSPVDLEEQNRSLQRKVEANMERRRTQKQEHWLFSLDCKMLHALLECETSTTQASENRFDGRLGTGEGFTISGARKPNRKFCPKCLLVKLDLLFKNSLKWLWNWNGSYNSGSTQ